MPEPELFWQTYLADAPLLLNLPTDDPRPAIQTSRQASVAWQIPPALHQTLAALSQQASVPLGTTLLSAFAVLLARYARQTDVVVGVNGLGLLPDSQSAARQMVPLRVDVADNPPFRACLAETQKQLRAVAAHADVPFVRIVEILHIERERGYQPLTQVAFLWQAADAATQRLPSAEEPNLAAFDISLVMTASPTGLSGVWNYHPDLFAETTIRRMIDHMQRLLEGIAAAPDQRVAALPLVGRAEWHELVETRNATQADYSQAPYVHQAIEQHAARDPVALAVTDGISHLTYAALNARANQLAHALRQRGVGSETVVGVCLERSLDMIVALLGILKAGGAYLPIDPAYPAERRAFIVRDAQVSVLITQPALADDLASPQVHLLFPDAPELLQQPVTNPLASIYAEQLAYVIYTSGSTGVPKGAQITHGNLRNLNMWYQQAFSITPADRQSQFVGPGFDATIMEIWPSLTSGASLHIVGDEARLEPAALRDWLVAHGITLSMIPTVLAEQLIRLGWPASSALRCLLTGAEALRTYPRADFPAAFINNYGPTETTVLVTSGLVRPDATTEVPPSIGRQIANTRLYLLDDDLQPVPEGVVGELYIGGTPVGRGYVGRPDLTAERFIPDPLSPVPGARMYRTGDLCRYRANGEIEYIGRADNQVKVRGYRIELGEIETVLMQQPQVREGVVVLREDTPGDKRIVAYVTPAFGAPPTVNILRDALQTRLPSYMVPTAFVVLDALPMTANGKIDRRALPLPDFSALAAQTYVAPRTPTEVTLAQIWADVLHLERVGIDDDLFALGAHSLLATRISSRTRAVFQLEVPLRVVFEQPTIRQMAEYIVALQNQSLPALALNRIDPAPRGDRYLTDLLDRLEPLADADAQVFLTAQTNNA